MSGGTGARAGPSTRTAGSKDPPSGFVTTTDLLATLQRALALRARLPSFP
jgi:hypothetical protein